MKFFPFPPASSFILILLKSQCTTPTWCQPKPGPQPGDELSTMFMRGRVLEKWASTCLHSSPFAGEKRTQLGRWWLLAASESPWQDQQLPAWT